jgi:linoleate 10R-lipoxygenase
MMELLAGLKEYNDQIPKDPMERPFAHLKRGPDGKFADDDLVKILQTGVEEVAGMLGISSFGVFAPNQRLTKSTPGAFGARNVPKCLRAISILGMRQARAWNCGSLNEFRKFFGLKTYDTFEEINPDPYVAEQLKHLYGG